MLRRPFPGLDEGETLLAHMTVTFRGSLAMSTKGLALASSRARLKAFSAWAAYAEQAGFPAPKPEMMLGVTDRRVVVWRPTFWFGRPKEVAGTVAFDDLAQVDMYRQGLSVSLAFVFKTGQIVEVESMRARPMRALRDALQARVGNVPP